MRKLATIAGTFVLFAATIVPALGAGNSCTNSTTGPGPSSNNICNINNVNTVTVNNVNDAIITNNITARSNSGGNSASNNTLGGSIATGNVTLNATVSNIANINTTNVTVGLGVVNNVAGNEITGPFSNNFATLSNVRTSDILNSNTASVNNTVDMVTDSGSNNANNNTGPAVVQSGNARLGLLVGTHVNDSLTAVSFGGGGTGNNTADNSTTGPSSINTATITNVATALVNNVNDLLVGNYVDILANTGRNKANNNTLGGNVTTGDVAADVAVDTEGNINTTQIAMAMGGFSNEAGSSVTGPFSSNFQTVSNLNTATIDNWNNKCRSHNADSAFGSMHWDKKANGGKGAWVVDEPCDPEDLGVFNYDNDVVDAGTNNANNNTGGGDVIAGWAQLVKQILTHLNDTYSVIQL